MQRSARSEAREQCKGKSGRGVLVQIRKGVGKAPGAAQDIQTWIEAETDKKGLKELRQGTTGGVRDGMLANSCCRSSMQR
ncbi:hypothetical protein CVT26_014992 [Gymnopilus dilepis]|uniref:Uncharacterized protein n=1 Tax=Gymnopilus dilepis TaxID=231916 RepID=A0A409YXQ9_9AGAR|nr:hypothetical protein CVT26_014992 [Gymnopilus dilepis]